MAIAQRSLVSNAVKEAAHVLEGTSRECDSLLTLIHGARFCLLGEATHGTHEFYRERAEITKRLIKREGLHRNRGGSGLAGRLPREPLRAWSQQ